ncbi:hypothetical protein POF50_025710 [Streptomyces sp. SL13]|uniref:Uncharacterized protein n=1 Tax=Streptantibioticus silvisoli TaxID=2705255 RepID=A0AA90HD46_9ACTN|nr:hypothetical protein [Streptantibioticus silvisoli]MDI5972697.1 hypothetical protein [Streptantibioticus silvisoli]
MFDAAVATGRAAVPVKLPSPVFGTAGQPTPDGLSAGITCDGGAVGVEAVGGPDAAEASLCASASDGRAGGRGDRQGAAAAMASVTRLVRRVSRETFTASAPGTFAHR